MRKLFIALVGMLALAGCSTEGTPNGKPVKVIIDTDMGNDIDDAVAVAAGFNAQARGELEILAIGCHKKSATAAKYVDQLCTFYGHAEVEVGMSLTPVAAPGGSDTDYTAVADSLNLPTSHTTYGDPVKIYRRLLSQAEDHSVAFVSLGFGTNLAALLESGPDDSSPLDGRSLVARKAAALSIMAGSYGSGKMAEYNVVNDIPAMQKVFAHWPTAIYQNPFEIGPQVMISSQLIDANLHHNGVHPVIEGYKAYLNYPYDRQSWDVLSVIYLIRPDLFTTSEAGTVSVDDKGFTHFTPDAKGRHYVLSATIDQPQALKEYMNSLLLSQ